VELLGPPENGQTLLKAAHGRRRSSLLPKGNRFKLSVPAAAGFSFLRPSGAKLPPFAGALPGLLRSRVLCKPQIASRMFAIVVVAALCASPLRSLALERRTLDEAEMATNAVVSSKFGTFPRAVAFIFLEPSKGASHGSRFTSVANRHPHSNHSSDLAIRRTARLSGTKTMRCVAGASALDIQLRECGVSAIVVFTDSSRYFPPFVTTFNIVGLFCLPTKAF
jgi:hypothetical protein